MRSSEKHQEALTETRDELLESLAVIISKSLRKFSYSKTLNKESRGWGRLAVTAISEAARIMKDVELDALDTRITALEEVLG